MAEDKLVEAYKDLIRDALKALRKDVKGLGFLNGHLRILPPLDTGGKVEVLFLVGKEDRECWTAWFEDKPEPDLPLLSSGW